MKRVKIDNCVVPKRIIFKRRLYEITYLDEKYFIFDYAIDTDINGKIFNVFIDAVHPNANPNTGSFCIPNKLRKHKVTNKSISMIESMLQCFDYDDCYFRPIKGVDIDYKKENL